MSARAAPPTAAAGLPPWPNTRAETHAPSIRSKSCAASRTLGVRWARGGHDVLFGSRDGRKARKFFGSWACARYAAPRMPAGGSITFLTGGVAVRPRSGLSIVTATFAGLEALSRALALELGPLRVNTIRPGLVDSEMWSFLDDAGRERLRQKARATFPVRRIGTIDDIGHAAV